MSDVTNAMAGIELTTTLVAYLDPGSGSMVLQIMIAGLFSSVFFLKSLVGSLKNKLSGMRISR